MFRICSRSWIYFHPESTSHSECTASGKARGFEDSDGILFKQQLWLCFRLSGGAVPQSLHLEEPEGQTCYKLAAVELMKALLSLQGRGNKEMLGAALWRKVCLRLDVWACARTHAFTVVLRFNMHAGALKNNGGDKCTKTLLIEKSLSVGLKNNHQITSLIRPQLGLSGDSFFFSKSKKKRSRFNVTIY